MWDWGFYEYPYLFADWFMDPMFWYREWELGWGYGGYDSWFWGGYFYPGNGTAVPDNTLRTVSKDQLKAPSKPHLAMPKEFQAGLKTLMTALRNHDANAVDSMLALGDHAHVVARQALGAADVRIAAMPLKSMLDVARSLSSSDPSRFVLGAAPLSPSRSQFYASREFHFGELQRGQSDRMARIKSGERLPGAARPLPAATRALYTPIPTRHLDWNPDVRMAAKMGVDVRYASAANEIYSPQLNISSSTVHALGVAAGGMASYSGGSGASGSSGGGYAGDSSGGVSSGGSASGSTVSASAGGGGGGHIK
jgi:hypothetical protein